MHRHSTIYDKYICLFFRVHPPCVVHDRHFFLIGLGLERLIAVVPGRDLHGFHEVPVEAGHGAEADHLRDVKDRVLRAAQQVARLGDARVVQEVKRAGTDDRVEEPSEMRRAQTADVSEIIHVKLFGIMVFYVVQNRREYHGILGRPARERGLEAALALDPVELDAQRQQKSHGTLLVLGLLVFDLAYDHRCEIVDIGILLAA